MAKFIAVDVWRSVFGPVSAKAIKEIYIREFNVPKEKRGLLKLPQCIKGLRKLEDPTYVDPTDRNKKKIKEINTD